MDFEKIHWLTAIFLHLPVRAEAFSHKPHHGQMLL
jgi:hypothetical protein